MPWGWTSKRKQGESITIRGILYDLLRVPEARRRVIGALAILCVFRAGFHVPVPGASPLALEHAIDRRDHQVPNWLAAASQWSAGNANTPMLFALGVLPRLVAALLFSILALAIPSWRALLRSGEDGRRLSRRYLRYLTVVMCILLGSVVVGAWSRRESPGFLYLPGWGAMLQVLTLSAGSVLLLWLCEKLSGLGIGDGMAFLAAAGLLARAPDVLSALVRKVTGSDPDHAPIHAVEFAIILGMWVAVVAGVVLMRRSRRDIPLQRQDPSTSCAHSMPLGLSESGSLPLLLSRTLALPAAAFLTRPLDVFFAYYIASCFLVLCLCRFWTRFTLQPMELAENLRSHGVHIPGVDPGTATAEHLERIIHRMAYVEAAFIAALIFLPPLLLHAIGIHPLFQLWAAAMVVIAWGGLDFIEAVENIPVVLPEEPPLQGQPSRLQPTPHAPSMRARASPNPGLEGA